MSDRRGSLRKEREKNFARFENSFDSVFLEYKISMLQVNDPTTHDHYLAPYQRETLRSMKGGNEVIVPLE